MEKIFEEFLNKATEFYYNKLKNFETNEDKLNKENALYIARSFAIYKLTTLWQEDLENAMTGNEQIDDLIKRIIDNRNKEDWNNVRKELQSTSAKNDELLLDMVNFKNNISCFDDDSDFRKSINSIGSKLFKNMNASYSSKNDGRWNEFYDTFTNNMYAMFRNYEVERSNDIVIIEKRINIDYGNKAEAIFGIGFKTQLDNLSQETIRNNVGFSILERKLMKIITNEFIERKGNTELYIPIEKINMYLFDEKSSSLTTRNRKKLEGTIDRLNSKYVYYDVSNSRYLNASKFEDAEIDKSKQEKLVSIQTSIFSRLNKSSDGNIANKIKGLNCKLEDFWKIRYLLNQINSRFPSKELLYPSNKFVLAERLFYKIHINQKKIFILDLMKELYFYKKDGMIKENNVYDDLVDNSHQKKLLDEFIDSMMEILGDMVELNILKSFDIYNEDKKLTGDCSKRDEDDNILEKKIRFKNGTSICFSQLAINTIYIKLESNSLGKKRKKKGVKTKHQGEKNRLKY